MRGGRGWLLREARDFVELSGDALQSGRERVSLTAQRGRIIALERFRYARLLD